MAYEKYHITSLAKNTVGLEKNDLCLVWEDFMADLRGPLGAVGPEATASFANWLTGHIIHYFEKSSPNSSWIILNTNWIIPN